MIKSKAWNWNIASAPQWEEPAPEVFPLLRRWQKQGFKKLLDLGCGIGRHSILFSENNFEVDACDLSAEGIDKLNILATKNSLSMSTKVCDMLSLPYSDKTFDCLIAFHAIYHSDDEGIQKTISEIKRILKSGGEAFITFNSKNNSAFKNPDNKHLSDSTIVKIQGHEAGIPHYYASKQDVENLLKDFEIIEFSYKEEYLLDQDYTGAHYYVLLKK
ncbi:MAG: class I SAM-dependent methyltransferase [Candidatus Woesebacteria bacterium]|nr:class I SAM-dependent methyltransferase [Candidatus Woesebacteria bacterium]